MADRGDGMGISVSVDPPEHQRWNPGGIEVRHAEVEHAGVGQSGSFWHGWHHSLPSQRTGSLGVSRPVGQHSDERFDKLLSSHDRSVDTTPPRKTDHKKDIRC